MDAGVVGRDANLHAFRRTGDRQGADRPWTIAKSMLMVILLPLLPGMAILRALQTLAIRLQPFIGRTTGVATLLLAVLSVLVPGDDLSGAKGHLAVAAQLVSFQIVTTLPYWFGFGLPHEEKIVLSAGTEPASSDQGGRSSRANSFVGHQMWSGRRISHHTARTASPFRNRTTARTECTGSTAPRRTASAPASAPAPARFGALAHRPGGPTCASLLGVLAPVRAKETRPYLAAPARWCGPVVGDRIEWSCAVRDSEGALELANRRQRRICTPLADARHGRTRANCQWVDEFMLD